MVCSAALTESIFQAPKWRSEDLSDDVETVQATCPTCDVLSGVCSIGESFIQRSTFRRAHLSAQNGINGMSCHVNKINCLSINI